MSTSNKIPANIMNCEHFHRQGITGKGITVAILDSGLSTHPDLPKHRIAGFCDFVQYRTLPYDDFAHGTHVAGIIGGEKTGIAPETRLIGIKVLDENGDATLETFIDGITWILHNYRRYHIRIVNISVGGSRDELNQTDNRLNRWVRKLWEQGLIVICSAGNNGPRAGSVTAPGNLRNVITVGSSDGRMFSSAGPVRPYITKPELVAPGTRILSTKPTDGYITKSGTSMSVPFVSGAVALLLQLAPYLGNDAVKIHLMNTARPLKNLPYNMQGAGLLDIEALLHDFL